MSRNQLDQAYVESVDQFLDAVPQKFLKTLREKIMQGKEDEALNLVCQYVVKFFTYVPYNQCYHHGHFVYALLKKAGHGLKPQ